MGECSLGHLILPTASTPLGYALCMGGAVGRLQWLVCSLVEAFQSFSCNWSAGLWKGGFPSYNGHPGAPHPALSLLSTAGSHLTDLPATLYFSSIQE